MKFENHADYMKQREALINRAQDLLNEGNMGEEYQAAKQAVTDLDNCYEEFANEQANLNALNGTQKPMVDVIGLVNKGGVIGNMKEEVFNSMEYRKAFMNHVINGEAIPAEFLNGDATTKTSDVGAVIPTTVLERIIEKMESTGMVLPLVTKTAYKGAVSIPTSTVKPTATWVAEGAGSDTQKKTTGSITFAYHKLRCAVSVSIETETMAVAAFETALINNVSQAMIKALEQSIISGDGTGKPKGILTETVVEGQNIDVAKAEEFTYQTLVDAESILPLAYENGAVWFMTKATFMKFIGMVDANKQPIARTNYGINGKPERTLLGRRVILNDYMTSVNATIESDTVVAFMFNPEDYVLNTNLNITMKKYEDNATDDIVTKAIMLVDGKVVDKNSLVTITKKTV